MIESSVFKAGRGTFARLLFERHAQGWIFGGVFLFIVAILLGCVVDYRIFILGIILVCLVAPGLMGLLYYNYGMKGENYLNVIDHRVEVGADTVSLFLKVKGEEYEEEDGKNEEENEVEWRRYDYPFPSFGRYSVGKDYVVFPFVAPRSGFLYLPADAFGEGELAEVVKRIASGIRLDANIER